MRSTRSKAAAVAAHTALAGWEPPVTAALWLKL